VDAPAEMCDDGGRIAFDGCSARCRTEEFIELRGIAAGGSVSATISGEVVTYTTTAGQTASSVAASLASQINARAALVALGVLATPIGPKVVVETGHITNVQFTDAGLTAPFSLDFDGENLWWTTGSAPNGYDVVRGNASQGWATRWDYSNPLVTEACVADNQMDTYFKVTAVPPAGQGHWYAVRVSGGSYDSGDPKQVGSRDPGINASGNGCP
jgi:cysteine-rich repeat protein